MRLSIGIIIFSVYCITASHQEADPGFKDVFTNGLGWIKENINPVEWMEKLKEATRKARTWIEQTKRKFRVSRVIDDLKKRATTKATCAACHVLIGLARAMINEHGMRKEEVYELYTDICHKFRIQNARVCRHTVTLILSNLMEAVLQSDMSISHICNFFLLDTCPGGSDPRHEWSVQLPARTNKTKALLTELPSENKPTLKVLQLSDIHFDSKYKEGTLADCDEPLCCREIHGPALSNKTAAGKWGSYKKCDTNEKLLENLLEHISNRHKDIDYILWTGDVPPHDIWEQTEEGNKKDLEIVVKLLDKYFKGIQIYPSVGNHESCPLDSYSPPSTPGWKNASKLYHELDEQWSRWLPSETSSTIKRGAFYSILAKPGLRIISVNGNFCSRLNFWLLKNSTDPAGHLAWLIDELTKAEANDEKVHIVGHVPPGGPDCLKVWSRNYNKIVNRFKGTIMAQFFGHTHADEFQIFYDNKKNKTPVSIGYISPSVTPWESNDPAYRIYYVDGEHPETTRAIVDLETWKMDLDTANMYDEVAWYLTYDARKEYNMPSLLPKDWDNLITRMIDDQELFKSFHSNYYRSSSVMPNCNAACKRNLLCDLRNSRSGQGKSYCKDL